MPVLPSEQSLGRRPVPGPIVGQPARYQAATGSEAAIGVATAHLGEVVTNIGNSLYQAEEELVRARRSSELADAIGKATEEISYAEVAAKRDPEFATINQRFSQQAQDIGNKYLEAISDPVVKAAFNRQYQQVSLAKRLNVLGSAADKEQNYNVGVLDRNMNTVVRAAALTENPAEREMMITQGRLYISEAAVAGWITETEAQKREQSFLSEIAEVEVERDIREGKPDDVAVKLITDPEYAADLDPRKRSTMTDTAITKYNIQKEQARKDEELRVKEEKEKILTDLEVKFVQRKLKQEDIDAVKYKIGSDEYRQLSKALVSEEALVNDPSAVGELEKLLDTDPRKAAKLASVYQEERRITNDYLSTVRGKARSILREIGPKSQYEQELATIVKVLTTSETIGDIAPGARAGLGAGEFMNWYRDLEAKGKIPSNEEISAKAADIIDFYSIIDIKAFVRKTGKGFRDLNTILNDISEETRKLNEQMRLKQITPQEYGQKILELSKRRQAAEQAIENATNKPKPNAK